MQAELVDELVDIDLGWDEAMHFHDVKRKGYVVIREGSRDAGIDTYIPLAELPRELVKWRGRTDVFLS